MKFAEISKTLLVFLFIVIKRCYSICPPGFELKQGEIVCSKIQCVDGQFFDTSSNQCRNCDHTCSKCDFYSNYCSQCKDGFYLYNQSCLTQCPQMKTYVSCVGNSCKCESCHSSCVQCFGEKNTQCLGCSTNYYFNEINTSCTKDLCDDGYTKQEIIVGENKKLFCIPCDSNCKTCSQIDGKLCLTCKNNMYLDSKTNKCIYTCPDFYYKSNGTCKKCPEGCQDCYANPDQSNPSQSEKCLTCIDTYTLNIEDQSCQKTCPGGYVLEPKIKTCIACHPSCKNCSDNTIEGCTQCQNGYSLVSGAPSKCENNCTAGNYSNNSLCLSCNTSCSECFGSDNKQCTKCKEGYFLYNTECLVICPIQFYTYARKFSSASEQPKCDYCTNEMEECEQDKDNLLQINPILCKKGYYKEDGKCVKQCKDHTFYPDEDTRTCIKCKFPCLTCLTDSICLTCDSYKPNNNSAGFPYNFALITKNSDTGIVYQQNCVPTCPQGFYSNPTTKICEKCHQNCQTCSGPSDADCITCQKYNVNNMLFKYNNQCFYTCPQSKKNPMYGDSSLQSCLPCSTECSSCFKGDNQSCYSCLSGYFLEYLKPECKSFCQKEGTYKNAVTNTCSLCSFGCSTCTDGTFNSCITCLDGYYLQQEYNVCKPCPKECKMCTSQDVCQSCNSGYFYHSLTNACLITCPFDGFYTDVATQSCQKCHSSCLECYGGNDNQCISCHKGNYLGTQGTCNPCNACDECSGPNTTDCLNQATCQPGYYQYDGNCLKCFENCSTCSGTTYDSCISCKNDTDYLLLFDICKKKDSPTDSKCDKGFFFDQTDKKCYSCHQNCIECTGKSSSQCTKCSTGNLLHKDITTCHYSCLDGYNQSDLAIPECQACLFNCNTGCSKGYSFLLGLCFTDCPFGTTSLQQQCNFNNKPSIQFAQILGSKVNNNSQPVKIQLHVYSIKQYSITWNLFEGDNNISSSVLSKFIKNRSDYIVLPQKSLKSNTKYKIKASIFDTSSNCQSENDCYAEQTFETMSDIVTGSLDIEVDKSQLQIALIISGWLFDGSADTLSFDLYVKLTGNDYFFFDKGRQYADGRYSYYIPNLNLELLSNKAQFYLVVYNDFDVQISQKSVALGSLRNLVLASIQLDEFIDSVYTQITTLQQIQRASYEFFTQMQTLISSQTSSQTIFNRHLFYQAYNSIKGVQLECDSNINCSGNGKCSWNQNNLNEVVCTCNNNYAGKYCEFESFQLDVAKQHLIKLIEKVSNIEISQQSDLFLSIEILLNLSQFYSIFDEFTLNTLVNIYFQVFEQLKRIQTHISDEKILFKISRLTSHLINLINETETLSYNDQQVLLMKTMNAFDTQINLFLQNFADSYDDLMSLEKIQTSFQTQISHITLNLLYENDLLDAFIKNQDRNPNEEGSGSIQILFQGDQISYTFDLNQFSAKSSLSTAVIKWKSNPFLSESQYQAPFISCITKLIIFSEETPIEISTVDSIVEISIPKILPTPILKTSRPFLSPYTCVYFDQVSQVYKQDGVSFLRENSTHIICGSEQISGNYGVIVNQESIDLSLSLTDIWNATSSIYGQDKQFIEFMNKQINKQTQIVDDSTEVSESTFNPNLSLLYAILIYGFFIFFFIIVSLFKDKRDPETFIKETDSYWLTHPIYSLMCGPYSTFFPRLSRSLNYSQILINLFLYNAIFVRVFSIPSESDLEKNLGKRQGISLLIGISSVACSIFTYYFTIGVVNFFKMRWFIRQRWLDFKEEKITNEIVDSVIKNLKIFHLMNYGLVFLLQVGMGVPIILLILTSNRQQNQFFFTSLFASVVVDNILDTIVLIGFCFIRIFSKSDKSNLILFFTLRGFYFPSSEFNVIESKIKQFKDHGEINEGEQGNHSDDEIFELNDDQNNNEQPKGIFKQNNSKQRNNLEEVQLTEFVNKLETKM